MKVADILFSLPVDSVSGAALLEFQENLGNRHVITQVCLAILGTPFIAICFTVDCLRHTYHFFRDFTKPGNISTYLCDLISHVIVAVLLPFHLLSHLFGVRPLLCLLRDSERSHQKSLPCILSAELTPAQRAVVLQKASVADLQQLLEKFELGKLMPVVRVMGAARFIECIRPWIEDFSKMPNAVVNKLPMLFNEMSYNPDYHAFQEFCKKICQEKEGHSESSQDPLHDDLIRPFFQHAGIKKQGFLKGNTGLKGGASVIPPIRNLLLLERTERLQEFKRFYPTISEPKRFLSEMIKDSDFEGHTPFTYIISQGDDDLVYFLFERLTKNQQEKMLELTYQRKTVVEMVEELPSKHKESKESLEKLFGEIKQEPDSIILHGRYPHVPPEIRDRLLRDGL